MRRENRIAVDKCELKPCPFCGEYVRFDVSFAESRLFTGECPGCGMKFEYQENVSLNAWMLDEPFARVAGLPLYEKLNPPFVEVWNKRANEEVET